MTSGWVLHTPNAGGNHPVYYRFTTHNKNGLKVEKTIETEKDKEDALEHDDVDGDGENGDNA